VAIGMLAAGGLTPVAFSCGSGTTGRGGAGAGGQGGPGLALAATAGDEDTDADAGASGGITSGGIGLEGISATGATPAPELGSDRASGDGSPRVVVVISVPGWFRIMSRTQRSPGPLTVAPPANEAATSTMANNPLRNDGPPCQRDANRSSP
jgi:hypothetical protein